MRSAVAAVVGAWALLASVTSAWAISPGCAAFNGARYFENTGLHPLITTGNVSGTGFNKGDVLRGTATGSGEIQLDDSALGGLVPRTTSFTYVVPADTSSNIGVAFHSVTFADAYTWSCTPAGLSHSDVIEQMRTRFGRISAETSARNMGDAVNGAIGDAFSGNATTQFGNGLISTSFAALESARDVSGGPGGAAEALAYRAAGTRPAASAMAYKAPPAAPVIRSPWHVWIDGRYTGFDDNTPAQFSGSQTNVTGGASYRFTPNFLAGVLVGYENFRYALGNSPAAFGGTAALSGNGVSGGSYFGWRFVDQLQLDGMMTYSRIDYGAQAGPVTSSFDADRVGGMLRLSGRYGVANALWVQPSSLVSIVNEHQQGFLDSAGVVHNSLTFLAGRSSTGSLVGMPIATPGGVLTPTLGAYADYRFGDQDLAALATIPTLQNGWSAHVNGGLAYATPGGVTASLNGEYGGLGQSLRYWQARANIGVRF